MNGMLCILIPISLKFVSKDLIDNKSALVQVMAWHRRGDKPLPQPMLTQIIDEWHAALGGDELTWDSENSQNQKTS